MLETNTLKKGTPEHRGFTLVEIIVSVALFALVMMIAIGALLTVVDANRKAQTLKSVVNNLNFALETIARTVRTGTNYDCGSEGGVVNCPTGNSRINFRPAEQGITTLSYRFCSPGSGPECGDSPHRPGNGNPKPEGVGWIERKINSGGSWVSMTADEVDIELAQFYVTGVGSSDGIQPRVTVVISGFARAGSVETEFNVQTSVSQRILEF